MAPLRTRLNVVLHQTRSPDNLGAVARLMANFGFGRLILSEPLTYAFRAAEKLAVKGERVLEGMRLEKDLPSALASSVYAVGTTSRSIEGRRSLTPEEAAARLRAEAARGEVALVFGGEKRGLSDAELSLCQDVLAIPTAPEQPSMNLAQAAAVLLFLCSREQGPPPQLAEEGASLGMMRALEARMGEVLLGVGYLNPQAPEHILGELWRSLSRGGLSRREAELWLAAFKQIHRAVKS